MARTDSLQSLREILLKRREALKKALAGDLSLLKELREQSKGDVIDLRWSRLRTRLTHSLRRSKAANLQVSMRPLIA